MARTRPPAFPSWLERILRVEDSAGQVVDWPRAEEWTECGSVFTTDAPERYAVGQAIKVTPMEARGCPGPSGRSGPRRRTAGVVREIVTSSRGAFVLVAWTP